MMLFIILAFFSSIVQTAHRRYSLFFLYPMWDSCEHREWCSCPSRHTHLFLLLYRHVCWSGTTRSRSHLFCKWEQVKNHTRLCENTPWWLQRRPMDSCKLQYKLNHQSSQKQEFHHSRSHSSPSNTWKKRRRSSVDRGCKQGFVHIEQSPSLLPNKVRQLAITDPGCVLSRPDINACAKSSALLPASVSTSIQ